ncbi:hypothetical protein H8356DRAFT_1344951 [Neocallimastix lanati (nom. inval.)]|nr:hypothetical protein H8356DRAFT_1344951 [Neocallimastix sp. JGI-2020a]
MIPMNQSNSLSITFKTCSSTPSTSTNVKLNMDGAVLVNNIVVLDLKVNSVNDTNLKAVDPILKKYIKQTEDNVKKMINCMKTIMNAQKQFAFVSKDAKLKGDEVVLKQKLNLRNDSLNSTIKNFHELLKTFLDIAIRDAEDSVYNYNTVRTEMDITTQMIAQTKQKLKYRRVTLILREYELSYKIKKDKYELLCDIPNYLQSVYDSMNIFYHQTVKYFPEIRFEGEC